MQRCALLILAFFGFTLIGQRSAFADSMTINFENLADGTSVGSTYANSGAVFNGAVVITAGQSLNELEFPPHSGTNVAFDATGPITVSFTSPITSFSAYFTYTEMLTLEAFGTSSNLLATAYSLHMQNFVSSGNMPNELISLTGNGISSVVIAGDPAGGSFVMDDVTIATAAAPVPEPSTLLYVLAAIPLFLWFARRR